MTARNQSDEPHESRIASDSPGRKFVGEPIAPAAGTFDARAMSHGVPGLPERFTWRSREYRITGLIRTWKTTGPCRHGSGEVYLRRHWYEVLVDSGETMRLYCDRQPRDRSGAKRRWWLFSLEWSNPAQ